MERWSRQLGWQWILLGALLIIGHFTVVWAGNVSPSIEDTGTNVGIGTTGPSLKLHISVPADDGIRIEAVNNPRLEFFDIGNSNSIIRITRDNFHFDTYNITSTLFIRGSDGNIGIGTTSPTAKLHVAGDVQVDGNLAAKYQDVAEWVQTPKPLPPGTVVVVDPQGRNQILPASQSYDIRVAGVVSAKPGLLLGEAGEGKVKVAQSGRVKVKVDASYGLIAVGDLLVTSHTLGHAMRSMPLNLGGTLIHRPGTLLGKALEPLAEGQGEILVLLTLQ